LHRTDAIVARSPLRADSIIRSLSTRLAHPLRLESSGARYFISHNMQIRAPREINKLLRARPKKKKEIRVVVVLVVAAIDPFDFWPFAHRRLNAAVPCASGVY
jgi:hypothetical protein